MPKTHFSRFRRILCCRALKNNLFKVMWMVFSYVWYDNHVNNVHFHGVTDEVFKHFNNESLVCYSCSFKLKGHDFVTKVSPSVKKEILFVLGGYILIW